MYRARYILLILGIVATLAFLLLSGPLYWRLYLGNPLFTDGLYEFRYAIRVDSNATTLLALVTTGLSWAAAIMYYYVVNSVRFDRWWQWTAIAIAMMIAVPAVGYAVVSSGLDRVEPGLSIEFRDLNLLLQIWTSLLTLIWFTIASFSIRWWSSNCRHTPFPQ